MDIYEGAQSIVLSTTRFHESSDLSTTYLGRTGVTRETTVKAGDRFAISGQGYVVGKLLDDRECQILLDTGVSESYVSKSYYLRCKSLHSLPKFTSKSQRIQVRNGQYIGVLFIIQIVIDIHCHRFEVFTLVSEIHENKNLVLEIKNIFKLEGIIS